MSKPIELYFTRSGSDVIDLSVAGPTDVLQVCYNYDWLLSPVQLLTIVGDPKYTLQISNTNDPNDFKDYDETDSVDVSILNALKDKSLPGLYLRVVVNPDGGSGTVMFKLTLKNT
jgi:hypothetical protein